jgi:hypothetical protein
MHRFRNISSDGKRGENTMDRVAELLRIANKAPEPYITWLSMN